MTPSCGRRLPVLVDQPPEVVGQSVLFGERHVDHRQRRALALIDAGEEERDDGVLDIGPVEMRGDGGAEPGQCLSKIRRCGTGRHGISGGSGAGKKARRARSGTSQNRPSFHLDTPMYAKITSLRNRGFAS